MPKKDGYVYIIARGYSKFNHKIIGVTENEDGTITWYIDGKADGKSAFCVKINM